MKVELIKPHGYCSGVRRAIELAYKAKEDNPLSNVFVLGELVHNHHVIEELKDKGIITLCGNNLVEDINSLSQRDVLIFTAHGHDPKLDEIASKKV